MDQNPLDLVGQSEAKAASAKASALAREAEAEDVKWLMGGQRGRRMVWRLLDSAGVFRSSFSPSAMQTAFNEGTREYGLRMLRLVHAHCPEQYVQMVKENANAGKSDGRRGKQ